MGSRVIFQPYKINAEEWQVIEDGIREDAYGKVICPVIIGRRVQKNENNDVTGNEAVTEEIYQDILTGIFTNSGYKVRVRIGRVPGLVVTYNNELICHNDKIKEHLCRLSDVFPQMDQNAAVDMLVAGVLNENAGEKFTPDCQAFIKKVNSRCKGSFSSEFVTMALKKYFCADNRQAAGRGMQYADYATLLHEAGEILKGRVEGFFDEGREEILLEELLYRFLTGNLIEKG